MKTEHSSTILIVDDEPANLAVLTEILQPYFRVRAANSGARALRVVASDPRPDLVLLDVMMPEMDGYAVLAALHASPVTGDLPVIFVTALSDELEEERGLEQGAVDYISKPVKGSTVLARIRTQLELKQVRDLLKDQNANLEWQVEQRLREIQLIQDVSLNAMAQLAETRDNETGNHILRTQAFVEVLASHMQAGGYHADELGDHQVGLITKAAPLHDIGKVGIPDSILLKPGPLTDAEFEVMKTHARIGGDAIAHALNKARLIHQDTSDGLAKGALAFLDTAQVIATSHHERWDGQGYPDGLSGSEIPLAARIMAAADVFDALTTRRVYKLPMSIAEATKYLGDNSGTQFDPKVVESFLGVQEKFAEISHRLGESAQDE